VGSIFLLQDGKRLVIINRLFCRDGSKALPEKKKFIASFLRQCGCVYGIGPFQVQKSLVRRGRRIRSRWGLEAGELQGQEEKRTLT
jgi:hypothetical protein